VFDEARRLRRRAAWHVRCAAAPAIQDHQRAPATEVGQQVKLGAPQALRSSITTRNAGFAIRGSRQARCPVISLAAGIDAASMARRCQSI